MKPKRLAYALLGFAAAGLGIWVVVTQHVSWWQFAVFAIAPDVTLLFGFHRGLQRGQLDPRVLPFYNAVHRFWAPAVLVVIALVLHADAWGAAADLRTSWGGEVSRTGGTAASGPGPTR